MNKVIEYSKKLFDLNGCEIREIPGHEGGRNLIFECCRDGGKRYILRISALGDREEEDYLAETEFVRYLADNGAPVAGVIPSRSGRLVERIEYDNGTVYACLFRYAKGMLISDNGYRYRENAPLEEYFFNTGKALGAIHRLSKRFVPVHRRGSFFDKYNTDYIGSLIPDEYAELKKAISGRLIEFRGLPADESRFGLVHFDFSDGNYHIDMSTGDITVFDFDNCMYCWYMFDLANLWTHGTGWCRYERDAAKRREYMERYFETVLRGYRSETDIQDAMLERLPLFIDMVLIENIVDEFECCARENGLPDNEDIGDAAECLINNIPYAGFC